MSVLCLHPQVYEARPGPQGPYAGACRLEPNGLSAARAISGKMHKEILEHGLTAQKMMFHDMEGQGGGGGVGVGGGG